MTEITDHRDVFFRYSMQNAPIVQSFFQHFLPRTSLDRLDLNSIAHENSSYISILIETLSLMMLLTGPRIPLINRTFNLTPLGLQQFYASGSTAGIQKKHEKRLRLILTNLDHAKTADDMDLPGLFMHKLKDDKKECWSVRVSGNWRITYRFIEHDVEIVNTEDYH